MPLDMPEEDRRAMWTTLISIAGTLVGTLLGCDAGADT